MVNVYQPVYAYFKLSTGILILIAFGITVFKVLKGSKSKFALLLMAFTFGYGINDIFVFIVTTNPVEINDNPDFLVPRSCIAKLISG